jgi:hypothetical protein
LTELNLPASELEPDAFPLPRLVEPREQLIVFEAQQLDVERQRVRQPPLDRRVQSFEEGVGVERVGEASLSAKAARFE